MKHVVIESAAPVASGRSSPWLLLGFLFVAYAFSMIDRQILSLLVEPIKADLGISDTQISLLQGFAFVILYSLFGLPLGVMVDRFNRTRLIAAGMTVWSLATAACGLAGSYATLFLARVGVGFGEAALSPAAYSLIGDSFPRRRLGLAMGVFAMGGTVGAGLALIAGGMMIEAFEAHGLFHLPWIGAVQPWQVAFMVVGLPGVLVALLFLILREPLRNAAAPAITGAASSESYLVFLRANRSVLALHHIAVSFAALSGGAAMSWVIPFFTRTHGWSLGTAGLHVGVANVVGALIGPLTIGILADRLAAGRPDRRLLLCAAVVLAGGVAGGAMPLVASPMVAAACFGLFILFASAPIAVGGAALQELIPSQFRGRATALYLFFINLVGFGIGPTLVAMISDHFFSESGGIGTALAIVLPVVLTASAAFAIAAARMIRRQQDGRIAER